MIGNVLVLYARETKMTSDPGRRLIILGAAGRDFHDFIMRYRDDPDATVVAFTATQIPSRL